MSTYYFGYSDGQGTNITVSLDTSEWDHISEPLRAFQALLVAASYHPDTISKYLDVEAAEASREKYP